MKVKIKDLEPNPWRDMTKYPLIREKIERLKSSIEQTGFWDNILCRKAGNIFQLAYGHHRLVAVKELGITEIDIPCKDLSDADMVRILALENREQEDMSQAVLIETVRVVRDFLNTELKKQNSWETSEEFLQRLIDKYNFNKIRSNGVGHATIKEFMGSNWIEYDIQVALNTLNSTDIEREAVEVLGITGKAEGFKRAVRNINKAGHHIPLSDQVRIAHKVNEKLKSKKTTGKTGGSAYYKVIEDIIKDEIGLSDDEETQFSELESDLKTVGTLTSNLSNKIASINFRLQQYGVEELRSISSLIIIDNIRQLLTNYGILTNYFGLINELNNK